MHNPSMFVTCTLGQQRTEGVCKLCQSQFSQGTLNNFQYRHGERRHLVKDGDGDGEGSAGVGNVHNAGQAALTGAARQQQVHLQARVALLR